MMMTLTGPRRQWHENWRRSRHVSSVSVARDCIDVGSRVHEAFLATAGYHSQ